VIAPRHDHHINDGEHETHTHDTTCTRQPTQPPMADHDIGGGGEVNVNAPTHGHMHEHEHDTATAVDPSPAPPPHAGLEFGGGGESNTNANTRPVAEPQSDEKRSRRRNEEMQKRQLRKSAEKTLRELEMAIAKAEAELPELIAKVTALDDEQEKEDERLGNQRLKRWAKAHETPWRSKEELIAASNPSMKLEDDVAGELKQLQRRIRLLELLRAQATKAEPEGAQEADRDSQIISKLNPHASPEEAMHRFNQDVSDATEGQTPVLRVQFDLSDAETARQLLQQEPQGEGNPHRGEVEPLFRVESASKHHAMTAVITFEDLDGSRRDCSCVVDSGAAQCTITLSAMLERAPWLAHKIVPTQRRFSDAQGNLMPIVGRVVMRLWIGECLLECDVYVFQSLGVHYHASSTAATRVQQ
jgi:hypothetical protein